jgi:hypothetical protein
MADGYENVCRTCKKLAVRQARAADPERYRAYDRRRRLKTSGQDGK